LVQKHLELTGHADPVILRAAQLVPVALFSGADGWVRTAHGFQGSHDFLQVLDSVAHTVFVDAYGDTVRSHTAWTTEIGVNDFTREMVLRDDMPSFGQLQQALGVAAAHVESDVVYDLLGSNPTMADGQPLFSAAHGNIMPAKALDATSLAVACATLATAG
jgi:hypothetical protein